MTDVEAGSGSGEGSGSTTLERVEMADVLASNEAVLRKTDEVNTTEPSFEDDSGREEEEEEEKRDEDGGGLECDLFDSSIDDMADPGTGVRDCLRDRLKIGDTEACFHMFKKISSAASVSSNHYY